ncbi:MAG: DUF4230 domain-containing protein [Synergistaceae bacterium]|nr:DUF4230 domain-containing protein [Synergistaceae bacterium]
MHRRRTPWTKPEGGSQESNPPVNDAKASEILFVDPGLPERPDHFWHGVVAATVLIFMGWLCTKFMFEITNAGGVNLSMIRSAIENCGEVISTRSFFESVADSRENSRAGRSRNFLIIFDGTVECGFDVRKLRAEVFEAERRVEITLPHCVIQRVGVNFERGNKSGFKVYDLQEGRGSTKSITPAEQNKLISSSLNSVRKRAREDWGITSMVEENAAKLYRNFLSPFNYSVDVKFTNDAGKLGVPKGTSADIMKGGGALIVHI